MLLRYETDEVIPAKSADSLKITAIVFREVGALVFFVKMKDNAVIERGIKRIDNASLIDNALKNSSDLKDLVRNCYEEFRKETSGTIVE